MFGDLLGNMQQQQEEMAAKLEAIVVEAEAGGGAVKVKSTASRKILNISIDKEKLDWDDVEMVEDLVLTAINNVLEKAAIKEAAESQKLISQMMPPGLGGLSDLFGK
ncbi:MAG: YbaB/EbfC family nucleoid-associated protein [Saprospiraceae bacterium]